jgi:dimethylargininase
MLHAVFTRAIVRTPGANAGAGLTSAALGQPDLAKLLAQHATYVAALEELGLRVETLPPLAGHPDAYFVEDAALVFAELAVVTRPGAEGRRGEADAIVPALARHRPLQRLRAPATLDGGDVLVVGRTVFVGLSARTNAAGAAQLTELLAPHGYRVVPVPVPAGLHLKSGVTSAGEEVLLATEALAGRPEFAGNRVLVVPPGEEYAANVLALEGAVLMPDGFPRTHALLARLGVPLRVLDQSEVRKMDGALTCLSLRF